MSAFVLGLILGGSVVVVGFALGCLFLGEHRPDVLDRLFAKDRTLVAVDDYRATTVPRPRPCLPHPDLTDEQRELIERLQTRRPEEIR